MASLMSCQRSGCAVCCGWDGLFAGTAVPGVSAVEGDDPGGPGGLAAFGGGALLESIFGADVPGAPVEPVALPTAVASLAARLASESGGVVGVDFIDTVSWAGG